MMKGYKFRYWMDETLGGDWGGYIWKSGGMTFRTNTVGKGLWVAIGNRPWHLLLSESEFSLPPGKTEALQKLLEMGHHVDREE